MNTKKIFKSQYKSLNIRTPCHLIVDSCQNINRILIILNCYTCIFFRKNAYRSPVFNRKRSRFHNSSTRNVDWEKMLLTALKKEPDMEGKRFQREKDFIYPTPEQNPGGHLSVSSISGNCKLKEKAGSFGMAAAFRG